MLANVTKGRIQEADKIVVYGVEGVGKTGFATCHEFNDQSKTLEITEDTNDCILIPTEAGSEELNVSRFPVCQTWQSIFDCITTLYEQDHPYKTIVFDSADWAQKLVYKEIAGEHNVAALEDIPYGKGYKLAYERFLKLIRALDALHRAGYNVIVIAHATIMNFKNPEGDSYDRYAIACRKDIGDALREWAKTVLFCDFDKSVVKVGEGFNERQVAKSYGQRVMHTQHRATHDAKNRYDLPQKMPLSWQNYKDGKARFFNAQH